MEKEIKEKSEEQITEETPEQVQEIQIENYSALLEELANSKETLVRTFAEFDNYKKRVEKEKEEIKKTSNKDLISKIIDILIIIDKAIENSHEQSTISVLNSIKGLIEQILIEQKVEMINPKELEKFDANLHFAQASVKQEDNKQQVVLTVIKPGFIINGLLVQPALVVVNSSE